MGLDLLLRTVPQKRAQKMRSKKQKNREMEFYLLGYRAGILRSVSENITDGEKLTNLIRHVDRHADATLELEIYKPINEQDLGLIAFPSGGLYWIGPAQ